MVIVLPITTTERPGHPFRIPVGPPEGGLWKPSTVKCDDIRSISTRRLVERLGVVSWRTMAEIEDRLPLLLGL
jgi:mRNA interferase MazF